MQLVNVHLLASLDVNEMFLLLYTHLNHIPSNGVATGENMFEPAVTSVFANVNLSFFVYFSSSAFYDLK